MAGKATLLILAKTADFIAGVDAGLDWVVLDIDQDFEFNILDVVEAQLQEFSAPENWIYDKSSLKKLRVADCSVLQSERFQKLFDQGRLTRVKNLKIYKQDEVFKCNFDDGRTFDLLDPRFYIDPYELPDACVAIIGGAAAGIIPAPDSAPAIEFSAGGDAPRQALPEEIGQIEKRMAETYQAAMEYNRLKAELVAKIKEKFGAEKQTYTGGFFRAVYTPPGIRRTIDSDRLKAAGLYEQFIKESRTSPSVRIVKLDEPDC